MDRSVASSVVPVLRRPDYEIAYENFAGNTFVHVEWSGRTTAGALRALRRDADLLFALHGGPIHTLSMRPHGGSVEKHRKFVAMMGFEFNRLLRCNDGLERALYTRWK